MMRDEERRAMRPPSLPGNRKASTPPITSQGPKPSPPAQLPLPKTQKIGPSNRSRTQSSKKEDEAKMPPKPVFHGEFRKNKVSMRSLLLQLNKMIEEELANFEPRQDR